MKKKHFAFLLINLFFLAIATIGSIVYLTQKDSLFGPGDTQASTQIYLDQADPVAGTDLSVEDIVTIRLKGNFPNPDPGDNPSVAEIAINFDKTKLQGTSITTKTDTLSLLDKIDNTNGKMSVDIAHIGPKGFEGDRVLVIFLLKVIKDEGLTTPISVNPATTIGIPDEYDGQTQDLNITLNIASVGECTNGETDGCGTNGCSSTEKSTCINESWTCNADDSCDIAAIKTLPVYQFWSNKFKNHFVTINENEKNSIIANYPDDVWSYEKIAYYAIPYSAKTGCLNGSSPLYRFWSPQFSGHFYTISENEKNTVIEKYNDNIWTYERIAYCAYTKTPPDADPVYRFWSEQLDTHFYTISDSQMQSIIDNYPIEIWEYERKAFFAYKKQPK